MLEALRKKIAAERALQLLLLVFLLGVIPWSVSRILHFQSFSFAMTIFVLNLVVCGLGLKSGRFRPFWISYAAGCVLSLVLSGMTSPIGLLLVLVSTAIRSISG
jgi:hypothetical protein